MVRKIWDDEQVEYLIEHYPTTTVTELTKHLPFTDNQIRKKASLLGLKKSSDSYVYTKWTDEEVELLKVNYFNMTASELVGLFNNKFSEQQIRNKLHKLKLHKTNTWTIEEEQYLIDNHKSMSVEEMHHAKLSRFTVSAITRKLYNLGYTTSELAKWTKDDEIIMEKYFAIKTNRELMELLPQFTYQQIKDKGRRMGLRKLDIVSYKSRVNYTLGDKWGDDELKILVEYYGKIPNKKIKSDYLPHRSVSAIKKKANHLGLVDKLRYTFAWHTTGFTLDENNPSKITITLEKRRADDANI